MTKIIHIPDNNTSLMAAQSFDYQVQAFISSIKRDLSPSTYKTYSNKLDVFISWYKEAPINGTIKNHLLEFRSYLKGHYKSAKSINLVLSIVRKFYKWLHENSLIDSLPTSSLKNIQDSKTVKKASLSRTQIQTIKEYLENDTSCNSQRNKLIFSILLKKGLRVSELTNIKIEDLGESQGKKVLYLLRKGYIDKSNFVKLSNDLYQEIISFAGDRKEGYLFTSHKTKDKLYSESVSRIVKQVFKACNMNSNTLSCHSLRHTYAILFLEAGGNIINLMNEMNHKSITTTQHYLKSFERMNDETEIDILF